MGIHSGPVVFGAIGGGLRMDHTAIGDAAKRVGFGVSRPLLGVNPRAQWNRIMQLRRPTYEALATTRVDTTDRPPEDIVEEIVTWLQGRR